LGAVPESVAVAAIGPTTAAACERAGRAPDVVAEESNAETLAEAVVGHIRNRECADAA